MRWRRSQATTPIVPGFGVVSLRGSVLGLRVGGVLLDERVRWVRFRVRVVSRFLRVVLRPRTTGMFDTGSVLMMLVVMRITRRTGRGVLLLGRWLRRWMLLVVCDW